MSGRRKISLKRLLNSHQTNHLLAATSTRRLLLVAGEARHIERFLSSLIVIKGCAASCRPSVRTVPCSPQISSIPRIEQGGTLVKNKKQIDSPISAVQTSSLTRRKFVRGAATIAAVAATVPLEPIFRETAATIKAAPAGNGRSADSSAANRSNDCFNYRKNMALANKVNMGPQADNGDAATFTDFSCSYSKGLLHDSLGIPSGAAMTSLKNAFATGSPADFANIVVGTPGGGPNSKLNGPQVALAFDLEGLDSHASVIPVAPSVASAQTAAEAVEHYWGALLADVSFTDYATNTLAG